MAQRTIDNVIQGIYADVKPQQEQMHEYFNTLARRVGTAGATQFAANIAAPYATQASQAAAGQAMNAAKLDEQKRQFQEQLAQRRSEFSTGQQNWEKQFAEYQKNQDMANMMSMFQNTGWTPQLLDALGYGGLGRGDMRNLSRQLDYLGFQQPGGFNSSGGGGGSTSGSWNNWGGRTGLVYG